MPRDAQFAGMSQAKRSKPPRISSVPVVGDLLWAVRGDENDMVDAVDEHGDVIRINAGLQEAVMAVHPDHLHQVLVEEPTKYRNPQRQFGIEDIGPEGLLGIQGDQWKRVRQVVNPAFTAREVQGYVDVMREEAAAHVEEWEDGQRIDLWDEMEGITTDVIGRALFSNDFHGELAEEMRETRKRIVSRFSSRSMYYPKWLPLPANRRYYDSLEKFYDVVDGLIEERTGRDGYGDDLLAILLEAGDEGKLTDGEVRDQVFQMLFPDQTTALGATYTVFLAQTHTAARESVETEADAVGRDPTFADFEDLRYAEYVVKEALRMHPPSYEISRRANEDVELGGYHVAEDTLLVLSHHFAQHDDRWWDEPETFRPERWESDELPVKDFAWAPFGGGPRGCLANRFVQLELRMILSAVARRYRLEPAPGQSDELDLKFSLNLRPKGPVEMIVRER